jgi:hypothetical protein
MKMASTTSEYKIRPGLVDLTIGSLSISNLDVQNVIISGRSVIRMNEEAGDVEISESTFEDIERTGSNGKGGVIEGYVGSNGRLTVTSCSFTNCKVNSNSGLGGGIYLKISNGA